MTQTTSEVKCPKCGSNQIVANKKGFSGKKAVVGGLLTGGIGLLAGTIGSNKVKITCMACGNVFNPGDRPVNTVMTTINPDPVKDAEIIEFAKREGKLTAVKFCKLRYEVDLSTAHLYVSKLIKGLDLPKPVVQKPTLATVSLIIFMVISTFTVLISATMEGWTTFVIFLILDVFFAVTLRNVIKGYKETKMS